MPEKKKKKKGSLENWWLNLGVSSKARQPRLHGKHGIDLSVGLGYTQLKGTHEPVMVPL